jgi:hypothetical protein
MKMAAICARVSSEQQREKHTIASQTAALIEFAKTHELEVPGEWVFEDDGYSGATLERPGLERVRGLAAVGQTQVYSPDGGSPPPGRRTADAVAHSSCGPAECDLLSLRPRGCRVLDWLAVGRDSARQTRSDSVGDVTALP